MNILALSMKKNWLLVVLLCSAAIIIIFVTLLSRLNRTYPKLTICRAELADLKSQLDYYKTEQGGYPNTTQGLRALISPPGDVPSPANWHQRLRALPIDPWKHAYIYLNPGQRNTTGFDLFSLGPDGVPSG